MVFAATVLVNLENILTNAFKYHNDLYGFLRKCQVDRHIIKSATEKATVYRGEKPSKRFVIKELLPLLNDKIIAIIITEVIKETFLKMVETPDSIINYTNNLRLEFEQDKQKKKDLEKEKEEHRAKLEEQQNAAKINQYQERENERAKLLDDFYKLYKMENAQARGFAFEKFLTILFDFESLEPRGSFKIVGEQIDGSFLLNSATHLLEAKWTKDPCAGADFGNFDYKIKGKTLNTRGLFISINGYSEEAIKGLNSKGTLAFIVIDGEHLHKSMQTGFGLKIMLSKLWRIADETVSAYIPLSELN